MDEARARRPAPTREEIVTILTERRNWGRWGDDDQLGTINLITPDKRVRAAALVRSGRSVSLSRPFPTTPGPGNPHPAQHYMKVKVRQEDGVVVDYFGINYHGHSATHLDALCHVWLDGVVWGGRDREEIVTTEGASWGGVEQLRDGIVTRGVLLDVPRFRGVACVEDDDPVHGWELDEAAAAQGITLEPGDAVLVSGGRGAWEVRNGAFHGALERRPGLHASCLAFLRDHDVALLGWDIMDAHPNEYGLTWSVHGAIQAFGLPLVDNLLLESLASACIEEGRHEFMLVVAPLDVPGGTGSPVNPIAIF